MTDRPLVSVLMPTWQGAQFLDRVLSALAAQELGRPWDFLAVDSGSSDGTLEILARHAASFPVPLRVQSIHPAEFDHGDTRNLLASRSRGELLVFLTQDAIPLGRDWLARLAANFDDPRVGAAYCRNVHRPDADRLTRLASGLDPGYADGRRVTRLPPPAQYERMSAEERRFLYNFNDVASAVRRELWERHPFPRTSFGEDVLMARALLEAGWSIVYDDAARVEHSHDYDADELRARGRVDGRFNAEWLGRTCVDSRESVELLVERQLAVDRAGLAAQGLAGAELEAELARAAELRRATYLGLWEGGHGAARRRPETGLLERTRLRLLYVVHGFPPETWAGTEVYTLELAREMQRLGHEVVVLARTTGREGEPEFGLREDSFEGLRVLRLVHRLQHGSLRDTYDQPAATAAFREVLLRERPDLVHFQHLIHLSAGLVQQAAEFNLPTVLTCHDYWAACARVQLIRPGGTRCERNMGAGCYLCVKEVGLEHVDAFERLAAEDPSLVAALRAWGETAPREDGPEAPAAAPEVPLGLPRERSFWGAFGDLLDRREVVPAAYRRADLRISPSRFLRDLLVRTEGFDPDTLIYSDNGLRTELVDALRKTPDPDGAVRFAFIGSLVWYKGVETLVEAMASLGDARCRLDVHGDFRPDSDAYHARLAGRAGPNVRFRGRFDNARLSEVYREIDVLVVPSLWYENSPITIHEAFLARTPVVTCDVGGMAEFVRDGVDGLHFRAGDARDLARALRRLCDEPDLIERLSRDWMAVKSIGDNARETEFRYRQLLCLRRAPRRRLLLDFKGVDTLERRGPVEQQGADLVLLRPGGAQVDYDLGLARGGPREVSIELLALAGEAGVEIAGRVLLDGSVVARVAPFEAAERDEERTVTFRADLGRGGAGRLTLDTRTGLLGRSEAYLRVRRVTVSDAEAPEPAVRAGGASAASAGGGRR